MEEQEVDQVIQVEVSNNLATDDPSSTASTTTADDNANNLSNFNVVEQPPSEEEEQGNTQACLEEDEINDMGEEGGYETGDDCLSDSTPRRCCAKAPHYPLYIPSPKYTQPTSTNTTGRRTWDTSCTMP